jgi:hypothetical protein
MPMSPDPSRPRCGRMRSSETARPPLRLPVPVAHLGRSAPESSAGPGRGSGARPRAPLPLPVLPSANRLPQVAAVSSLRLGIFPDPSPPIQVMLTQPLQSNYLSICARNAICRSPHKIIAPDLIADFRPPRCAIQKGPNCYVRDLTRRTCSILEITAPD